MHEDSEQSVASCNQLLQATMDALPHTAQRLLLGVTILKRNRWTHTIYVLIRCVWLFNAVVVTNQRCVSHSMLVLDNEGPCLQLYIKG